MTKDEIKAWALKSCPGMCSTCPFGGPAGMGCGLTIEEMEKTRISSRGPSLSEIADDLEQIAKRLRKIRSSNE